MLMRVPTAAILSLLALIVPGLTGNAKATDSAQPFTEPTENTKPLTEQLEESNWLTPSEPTTSAFPTENSRRELFDKPFYPGSQQPARKEKTISKGAEGSEVAAIQRRLQIHGFKPGTLDSIYGYRTLLAVKAFQQSQELPVTGVVDKDTWIALATDPPATINNAILTKGNTGSKVKTLQVRLESQGFEPGPVDGVFGSRTLAAVKRFQEFQGLEVSGIVDDTTWKALGGK